ncbi:MAG TPA: dienelactone hydrolase family protein [Roseiflexaceae bacterium]|nr:dienelactone hydrolase family protein [Roseiflexaceae bacterium]
MSTADLPLAHLVQRPRTRDGAPPLLVLLHGYGSNEHDLHSLAPYLDERLLVVSARAPMMLMPGSYAWFEIAFYQDEEGRTQIAVDPRQAALSATVAAEFVEQAARAYGADPRRVLVGGFSQGASIAAIVALTRPELAAGAAVLSGIVPSELLDALPQPERLAGKPFLVTHGTEDAVVPVAHGRATRELLRGLAVELTYHEYPGMAHEINMACLQDLAAWVRRQVG